MKKQFFTEIRVGLFVLLGLFTAMVVIFMLGSEKRLFESHYTLYTKFEDISGLRVGASVQLAGLNVGMVEDIRFSKDVSDKDITVVLQVNEKFQDRIRQDSTATINTQGLLGDKYVFITVGSLEEPILEDGGYIQSKAITPIFELAEKAGRIMDDIGAITEDIRAVLQTKDKEKGSDLRQTLRAIRDTMERIKTGPGLVHALIYDPQGKEVVADLSRTLRSIGDLTDSISDEGKKETRGLISNLRRAAADLEEILAGIKRGEGTIGKLVRDPELYNEIRTFFGKANRSKLIKAVVRTTLEENDKQIIK